MNKQTVNVNIAAQEASSYPIIIGENIMDDIGTYIKKYSKAHKLVIVTNTTVYNLFGQRVKTSLDKEGFLYEFVVLDDGEKYKNIDSLNLIWNKALEFMLERKDVFVALGGGVVGDITGFAASSYLRGVDFIQIPTTLLAQVDSSVGGKVAINHPLGKNMIGAFYQPKLVLSDVKTFDSLPVEQLKTGLAEVIKYGFIEKSCGLKNENKGFLEYLKERKDEIFSLNPAIIIELVKYCCELKAEVVNQDERESGLRAILNFGHTIGHAIEKCTNYETFTHGQAVAMGMKGAFSIAGQKGLVDEKYVKSSIDLINEYGLDYKIPENVSVQSLLEAMTHDKKVLSNKIRFVLPVDIAKVDVFSDVNSQEIEFALSQLV